MVNSVALVLELLQFLSQNSGVNMVYVTQIEVKKARKLDLFFISTQVKEPHELVRCERKEY